MMERDMTLLVALIMLDVIGIGERESACEKEMENNS
jgi:hypothetical protein